MKFSGKVGNGPTNKRLNFGGDTDPDPYLAIRNPDPYRVTGRTCLGGVCTVLVLVVESK